MKVGYLGPIGSFTYSATISFFEEVELVSFPTIISALKEIEKETLDYVVVPIENSIEGTVNQTLDFLYHQSHVPIQGEIILPITQNLMVHPNWKNNLEDIEKVKSHPQALAQSQQFLADYFASAKQVTTESTTEAAKWLYEHPDAKVAAVGSKEAAKMYQLEIVHESIQDVANNQTRFWIVGKDKLTTNVRKPKMIRQTIGVNFSENKPGNLHKILSVFSWRDIDLTKIESRPLRTKLGDYFFLIDISYENSQLVEMALAEIKQLGGYIKELGTYHVYLEKAL